MDTWPCKPMMSNAKPSSKRKRSLLFKLSRVVFNVRVTTRPLAKGLRRGPEVKSTKDLAGPGTSAATLRWGPKIHGRFHGRGGIPEWLVYKRKSRIENGWCKGVALWKLPYGGFQSHGGPRKHPKLVSITVSTNGLGYKNILGNPHIAETLSTTNIPGSVFRMADTEKQV